MTLVLVGPHAVGKSATGRALQQRLGWDFHEEIGRHLAADPRLRPTDVGVADSQEHFEKAVLEAELLRDHTCDANADRIVETWHPGNLAYVHARTPTFVAQALRQVRRHLAGVEAVVVPLWAPDAVLAERQNLPGAPEFYRQVGVLARRYAGALDLPVLTPIVTHNRTPDEVAACIITRLSKHGPALQPHGYRAEAQPKEIP